MAVDIGALRKFQDLWGPVLETIPAVMDSVAKQADMDRALAQAKSDYEKAKAEVQAVYDDADKRIAVANEVLAAIADKQQKAQEALDAAVVAADARARAIEQEADVRIRSAQDKVLEAEKRLTELDAEAVKRMQAVEEAHAKAMTAFEAEVKALEDRKAKAEKAIEALKAKFG